MIYILRRNSLGFPVWMFLSCPLIFLLFLSFFLSFFIGDVHFCGVESLV